MLKIILGIKDAEKYLKDKKYVDYNDGLFDDEYSEDWFNDEFIRRALAEIDHIDLSKSSGTALKNSITGDIHSPRELSTGCKTIILIYKYSNVIFQARFGDNCTDLLEEIAANKDITIKSDYLHSFNFNKISKIEYINYGVTATCKGDILNLLGQFRADNVIEEDSIDESELTMEEIDSKHPYLAKEIDEAMRRANRHDYN